MAASFGDELDLGRVLWRHKLPLAIAVLLGAVVGWGLSQLQTERFTAESRVFLSADSPFDPLGQRSSSGGQQRFVVQQAELMSSSPVLDLVELPPGVERADLVDAVEVTPSADSDLVSVSATALTRDAAVALADAVPVAYQRFVSERVTAEVERALVAVSEPELAAQVRAAAALYDDGVAVVEGALRPDGPSEPATVRNVVLLAVLAGLTYATGAVAAQSRRRRPAT